MNETYSQAMKTSSDMDFGIKTNSNFFSRNHCGYNYNNIRDKIFILEHEKQIYNSIVLQSREMKDIKGYFYYNNTLSSRVGKFVNNENDPESHTRLILDKIANIKNASRFDNVATNLKALFNKRHNRSISNAISGKYKKVNNFKKIEDILNSTKCKLTNSINKLNKILMYFFFQIIKLILFPFPNLINVRIGKKSYFRNKKSKIFK